MAQDNLLNKRIPELDESFRKIRKDDMFVFYDPAQDKTLSVRGENMVEHLLAEGDYVVKHYPEDTSEENPFFIGDDRVIVVVGDKLYKLVYEGRPYGSTNLEEEIKLGHWEQVGGKSDKVNWKKAPNEANLILDYLESPNHYVVLSPEVLVEKVTIKNLPEGRDFRINFLNCDSRTIELEGLVENPIAGQPDVVAESTDIRGGAISEIVLASGGSSYWLINHSIRESEDGEPEPYFSWSPLDDSEGGTSWNGAINVTHAEMVGLANASQLTPGAFYAYLYWAVYTQPVTGLVISKQEFAETLIVQAVTPNSFSGEAISKEFPTDKILLDALRTDGIGAVGVIKYREDTQGFASNDDWRSITYARWQTNGLHHHAATAVAAGYECTIVYGTVDSTRYREYYIQFPITSNPANPTLKLTKGAATRTFEMVKYTGDPIAANELATMLPSGRAIVSYSVALGKYVVFTSEWENALATGDYISTKPAEFAIGYGTRLLVTGAPQERYTFGSRTPTGRKVQIDSAPLSNITIEAPLKDNIYIGPSSSNTAIKADSISNFVAESGFSDNVLKAAFFENCSFPAVHSYSNLILSSRRLTYQYAAGIIQGEFSMRNSTFISQNASFGASMSLAYSRIFNALIRVYQNSFNLTIDRYSDSFWSAASYSGSGNDYMKFSTVGGKAFEYGSNREGYTMSGRDNNSATAAISYRDAKRYTTEVKGLVIANTPAAGTSDMPVLVRDPATGDVKTATAAQSTPNAVVSTGSPVAITKVWCGPQVLYDAIPTKDTATLYFITA